MLFRQESRHATAPNTTTSMTDVPCYGKAIITTTLVVDESLGIYPTVEGCVVLDHFPKLPVGPAMIHVKGCYQRGSMWVNDAHAKAPIESTTAPSFCQHGEESVLVIVVVTFAQTVRAILVGGTKTVVGVDAQTDKSVSAPFYLEQPQRPLVETT